MTTTVPGVGDAVFVRTVTYHYTGRIAEMDAHWIVLSDAAWIADSSRFADMLANGFGPTAEIEPYPAAVVLNRDAIVDMCLWAHDLPRKQQ